MKESEKQIVASSPAQRRLDDLFLLKQKSLSQEIEKLGPVSEAIFDDRMDKISICDVIDTFNAVSNTLEGRPEVKIRVTHAHDIRPSTITRQFGIHSTENTHSINDLQLSKKLRENVESVVKLTAIEKTTTFSYSNGIKKKTQDIKASPEDATISVEMALNESLTLRCLFSKDDKVEIQLIDLKNKDSCKYYPEEYTFSSPTFGDTRTPSYYLGEDRECKIEKHKSIPISKRLLRAQGKNKSWFNFGNKKDYGQELSNFRYKFVETVSDFLNLTHQ